VLWIQNFALQIRIWLFNEFRIRILLSKSSGVGSGSYFQKVPVSDPAFFLTKYNFKGPKMAFQNINFKEYLNLEYKNGQTYEITLFFDGFC
jgi:hypothetical protein